MLAATNGWLKITAPDTTVLWLECWVNGALIAPPTLLTSPTVPFRLTHGGNLVIAAINRSAEAITVGRKYNGTDGAVLNQPSEEVPAWGMALIDVRKDLTVDP